MKTMIIAEGGINHNGDIETAFKLIDVALSAKADAVKFQTFSAEKLVAKSAPKAEYQSKNVGSSESQFEMLKKLELAMPEYKKLKQYCDKKNIMFMSTPFDEESADMLEELGMQYFKIPSGELTNMQLIRHISQKGKPIILSTGMADMEEVKKAVEWISRSWKNKGEKPDLTILHCVSNYPTDFEEVNLLAINTMRETLEFPVGLSDHTMGIEVAIAAVALGASVIEKHFTLSHDMEGPDHRASLEPDELKALVDGIRNVEKAMGDGLKKPTKSEMNTKIVARRSIVASQEIVAGAILAQADVTTKRPGNGIAPEFMDSVIGKKVKRNISVDSVIKWEDLEDA